MEIYATLPVTMPREIVLSSFFAVALAITAMSQDVPQPIAAGASVKPAASPAGAETKENAPAATQSPAPKPDLASEASPAKAAESVAMPTSSGTSEASSLFSEPKLDALPPVDASIPEPTSAEEKAFRVSKNAVLKDDIKERVRYRQARTSALADPKIQQEYERATTAKTDPERRKAWESYYTLLVKKVVSFDNSLKARAEEDQKLSMQRITQRRLRGSEEPGGQGKNE